MTTTSINFHLRPSQMLGRHPGKFFIRIIHARQSRHISRPYSVFPEEWDSEKKRLIFPVSGDYAMNSGGDYSAAEFGACSGGVSVPNFVRPSGANSGNGCVSTPGGDCDIICAGSVTPDPSGNISVDRLHHLALIDESMKNDLKRLRDIVSDLSESGSYSASDVVARFTESMSRNTVLGYAGFTACRLREQGRDRTARAYCSSARSLTAFNGGKDVLLSQIDSSLMSAYESHLLKNGLKMNTVSFYLRNLRALYFRAVGERLIPRQGVNPFAGMHTGVYETRRRALNDSQLQALARLDEILLQSPARVDEQEEGAGANRGKASELRDSLLFFMFCYHARGMSFVDMAHLKKSDIGGDCLTYRRRKTGGLLEVKVTEPMRRIMSHFAVRGGGSEYIFPVIDSRMPHIHRQYETGLKRQNRSLKILAQMAGIGDRLSTHAARHTWATLAKRLHVPVAVIGEALGHRDVKTTSIYLASFDRATMDELSVRMSNAVKAA